MELGVTPDGLTLHVDDEVLVCDRDATMPPGTERGYIVQGHEARLGLPALPRRHPAGAAEGRDGRAVLRAVRVHQPHVLSPPGARSRRALSICASTGSSAAACTRTTRSPITRALPSSSILRFTSNATSPTCSTCASTSCGVGGSCRAPGTRKRPCSSPPTGTRRFVRALELAVERSDSPAEFANGSLIFRLQLAARR